MKTEKQQINFREVYEKFHKGDSLTTDEVVAGAKHFYTLGKNLRGLGPEFRHTASVLMMAGERLQGFAEARGRNVSLL